VNVSAREAEEFAKWRSKRKNFTYRLPTEEEWEYAARSGGEYKLFPWGESLRDSTAVVKEATPRPVGSYPSGKNRWGVDDLIGNVWEWTGSNFQLYPGNDAEFPAKYKSWRVVRGGSYASEPQDRQRPLTATFRELIDPTTKHPAQGFRLVRDGQ